jgi:hypothetical protein
MGPRGLCVTLVRVYSEQSLIAAFVKSSKRERYWDIVSNPRRRHKFTGQLAHFKDFDPKYRLSIPRNRLFVDNVARELQRRRSPSIVFAISEDPRLDRKEFPLVEALTRIVGRGMGTVLYCIPGCLAFVETEDESFILERYDPPEKQEYIRFVIGRKDETSQVEQGVFQAAALAQIVPDSDADELNELRAWFNENLQVPTSFGRNKLPLGICWFKTGSAEHISRIWELIRILERNGIYVKKIRTDKPGYVIYEDDWQIVAEPFRKGTMSRG